MKTAAVVAPVENIAIEVLAVSLRETIPQDACY
jgi:hypothetical protein